MSEVLTVRIAPRLLAKLEERAVQLGLDRSGYVRSLIEQDLAGARPQPERRFASEDLAGAFRLGGKPADNPHVREVLSRRSTAKRETDR